MRNRTENQMKRQIDFFLVRHGSTAANEENRYLGKTDEPLSEKGIFEIQKLAKTGKIKKADILFVSPAKRCVQSARLLFPDRKQIEIPQWQEIDFGLFEYKNYRELNGDLRYQAWIDSGGCIPFPGGESREEFVLRCVQGMEYAAGQLRRLWTKDFDRFSAAAVVHGGTIMALLSHYCGQDYFSYQVKNADGYRCMLSVEEEKTRMEIKDRL